MGDFSWIFPFLLISCHSFFSWKFLQIVSPFNFCCHHKIPWQRAASGRNGIVSSYNSIVVSRSRQKLQTVTSHLLSTAGGKKKTYILHCLPGLSSNLHSHTVQDSLPRDWWFPSWLCIPISITKTTPHPHPKGMLQSQHNAIFYWDSLPGCVSVVASLKWKASYHVLRNSQMNEPRWGAESQEVLLPKASRNPRRSNGRLLWVMGHGKVHWTKPGDLL